MGVQQATSAATSQTTNPIVQANITASSRGLTPAQSSSSSTPLPNSKPTAATKTGTVGNANNTQSSSSGIAPQLNAINQQEKLPPLLPTISKDAQIQNYTFSPTYSGMSSNKIIYLGYHGNNTSTGKRSNSTPDITSNSHDKNRDSSSKNIGDSSVQSSNHHRHSDGNITDSSYDTKSSAQKNELSKAHSQPNNHNNNDGDAINKQKKSSTSSANDHHKSGGDAFFGGDPFFNDDDDDDV
jgi:hypothetical protein